MPSSSTETVKEISNGEQVFLPPKSASYTDLNALSADSSPPRRRADSSPSGRRVFTDLSNHGQSDFPERGGFILSKGILRRKSSRTTEKRPIGNAPFNVSTEDLVNGLNTEPQGDSSSIPETKPPEPVVRPAKGRSVSGRLATLARKPWSSGARARSPSLQSENGSQPESLLQSSPSQPDSAPQHASDAAPADSKGRNVPYRRPRLPKVAVVTDGGDNQTTPTSPAASLRSKRSFTKLTSSASVSTPVLPPMPKSSPSIVGSDGPEIPRMKDELWGVFRNLDVEYQR